VERVWFFLFVFLCVEVDGCCAALFGLCFGLFFVFWLFLVCCLVVNVEVVFHFYMDVMLEQAVVGVNSCWAFEKR
jgi:hypothetical protein